MPVAQELTPNPFPSGAGASGGTLSRRSLARRCKADEVLAIMARPVVLRRYRHVVVKAPSCRGHAAEAIGKLRGTRIARMAQRSHGTNHPLAERRRST